MVAERPTREGGAAIRAALGMIVGPVPGQMTIGVVAAVAVRSLLGRIAVRLPLT